MWVDEGGQEFEEYSVMAQSERDTELLRRELETRARKFRGCRNVVQLEDYSEGAVSQLCSNVYHWKILV